jgi:hypothetical protein
LPSKKLSPTEIVAHRLEGLYFHYDHKFSQGHKAECKHLFTIEVFDNDEAASEEVATSDPMISIHALSGIHPRSNNTMQVRVDINGMRLTAFLDSGSTHNFINTTVAEQKGEFHFATARVFTWRCPTAIASSV